MPKVGRIKAVDVNHIGNHREFLGFCQCYVCFKYHVFFDSCFVVSARLSIVHLLSVSVLLCVVRLLREELQLLQESGSYVGEVVKPMDKKKVLVKVKDVFLEHCQLFSFQ